MQKNKTYLNFGDVIFSLKTFCAAILGLFIALYFGLTNPYWVLITVYIISNPFSGATASKAVYRLIGTIVGAGVAIVILPQLVNSPELTTLCLSLWVSICLFLSIIDHTPKYYAYMLAGYTAILISFPIVDTPQNVFTLAVSRVEEISIGIICVTVIELVFFPRNVKPMLENRIDSWLKGSADLIFETINGNGNTKEASKNLMKLSSDTNSLRNFSIQSNYDINIKSSSIESMNILQNRMNAFFSILENCNNLINLRNKLNSKTKDQRGTNPKLNELLDTIKNYISNNGKDTKTIILSLENLKETITSKSSNSNNWIDLINSSLTIKLCDLMKVYTDCINIRQKSYNDKSEKIELNQYEFLIDNQNTHRDYLMAFVTALATFTAICLSVAFWRETAWPQGGSAVTITGIFCCMYSLVGTVTTQLIRKLFALIFLILILAFVMQFAIFPVIDGFIPLVLTFGLVLIPAGVMMASPSKYILGLALSVVLFNFLRLSETSNLDLSTFINVNLALIIGVFISSIVTIIFRQIGTEWSAKRLIHANWLDIVRIAKEKNTTKIQQKFLRPLLDRFNFINIRLSTMPSNSKFKKLDVLQDAQVCLNAIALQGLKPNLDQLSYDKINVFLSELGNYYNSKLKNNSTPDDSILLQSLDAALNQIIGKTSGEIKQKASFSLAEMRENLFSNALPFQFKKQSKEAL